MKRVFLIALITLAFVAVPAHAITEQRTKNVATYVTFPIYKNDGTLISGAAGLDTECDFYADGTAPNGFADATNEATEIGSTGFYYLSLSQSEMNNDIIVCQVKSSTTGAVVTPIHITTLPAPADIVQISSDATAADNAEAMFDGAGYAGGTIKLGVDAVAISGDSTAADNLETMLDGTGGQVLSLKQLNINNSTGNAISAVSSGSNGHGIYAGGNGTGSGLATQGGATGNGAYFLGGASDGSGLRASAAAGNNAGLYGTGFGAGPGAGFVGGATGQGLYGQGGASGGIGIGAYTQAANAAAFYASPHGTGAGVSANMTGNITGNLSGSVGSVTGAVGSVSAGGITAASIATDAIDADAIAADAIGASELATNSITSAEIADGALDAAAFAADGTAQATGSDSDTIRLADAETYPDDQLNGALVTIVSGTGKGQSRLIVDYTGTGDYADVTPNWTTTPDNTSQYIISAFGYVPGLKTDAITATSIAAGAITSAEIATGAIDADALAADAVDEVWDEAQSGHTSAGTFGYYLDSQVSAAGGESLTAADIWSYATRQLTGTQTFNLTGNITGNLSGSVGSVTGAVGSVSAGGITATSIATDAIDADALAVDALAEINGTVDTALSDIKLDHLVAVADADDVVDNSIIAKLAAKSFGTADWSTFDNTTDSLEAIRDRGDAAWLTGAASSATATYTTTSWTRTAGDNDGGVAADTLTVNGTSFVTGETAVGNFLEVDAVFTVGAGETAESLDFWGYYAGGGSHVIYVEAYNTVDTTWEPVGVIGLGTQIAYSRFGLAPDHTDSGTNTVSIKFIHSAGGGVASHAFYVDKAAVNTLEPGGSSLTAADVWAHATRQLTGTQAFNLTGNITGNLSGSVGSVTGAVGSVTGNVGGNVAGSVGTVTSLAANSVNASALDADAVDEIWNELQVGHVTPGSFGYYLDAQVSTVGGGTLTVPDIVDGVLDELLNLHTGAGTVGERIGRCGAISP